MSEITPTHDTNRMECYFQMSVHSGEGKKKHSGSLFSQGNIAHLANFLLSLVWEIAVLPVFGSHLQNIPVSLWISTHASANFAKTNFVKWHHPSELPWRERKPDAKRGSKCSTNHAPTTFTVAPLYNIWWFPNTLSGPRVCLLGRCGWMAHT